MWFPGRVLLSHAAIGHSTIGAEGLNCRVRDGNGCYTLAVATGKFAVPIQILILDLRAGEISD